ncbi:DUF742 domain-containing protein [Streptomyces humicola]|uniref:DUF742 domain-containing protein n=1 Tax=Streptomyces humicola TaxID=2953240 RepID=UPI003558411E
MPTGQLPEHHRICHLCRDITSVAQVPALLAIPLGAARLRVADVAAAGMLVVHKPDGGAPRRKAGHAHARTRAPGTTAPALFRPGVVCRLQSFGSQ